MRMVQIATNPSGYRVHAGVVLKRYPPGKNQTISTQYHISDHNFNLDILLLDGSVIGTGIHTWSEHASCNIIL